MTTATPREIAVRNPYTGAIDFHFTPASDREIADICARLRQAQPAWSAAPMEHRVGVMQAWAGKLAEHRDALVAADSIDTGYGAISKVAPDMVINAINRTAEFAPAIYAQARRSGTHPALPHINYDTLLKPS